VTLSRFGRPVRVGLQLISCWWVVYGQASPPPVKPVANRKNPFACIGESHVAPGCSDDAFIRLCPVGFGSFPFHRFFSFLTDFPGRRRLYGRLSSLVQTVPPDAPPPGRMCERLVVSILPCERSYSDDQDVPPG